MKSLDDKNKQILNEILTSSQTGTVVCRLASKMGISPYEAFRKFILSNTYRIFRIPDSTYSYLGDEAICQLFLQELNQE